MSPFSSRRTLIASSAIALALCVAPVAAYAQVNYDFNLPAQPLADSLRAIGSRAGVNVAFDPASVLGKTAPALRGSFSAHEALNRVVAGSGLSLRVTGGGSFFVEVSSPQQQGVQEGPARATEIEEVVVTGSHIPQANGGGSRVQVITRDQIELSGYATINGYLQTLPQNFGAGENENGAFGLASPASGAAFGGGANLRGLGTASTLTLLNGQRVAPAGLGDFVDLSVIPVAAIKRIEVLTDGASAIYGADAVGGVINIITNDKYDGADTRLRYGAASKTDEYEFGQSFGKTWATGHALMSLDYFHHSGLTTSDRSYTDTAPYVTSLLPDTTTQSVFASASQEVSSDVTVYGAVLYSNRKSAGLNSPYGPGAPSVSFPATVDLLEPSAGIKYRGPNGWTFSLDGSASWDHERLAELSAPGVPVTTLKNLFSVSSGEAKAEGPLFNVPGGAVSVAIGAGIRHEGFNGVLSTDIVASRNVGDVFAEAFIPIVGEGNERPGIKSLSLTAALRSERYSDFGSSTNPKIGAVWELNDDLKLRASYGTSFRAPLFKEEFLSSAFSYAFPAPNPQSPTGSTILINFLGPNQDLKPETATTWTAGVDFRAPGLGVTGSVTYFNINYQNRISSVTYLQAFSDPAAYSAVLTLNPTQAQILAVSTAPYVFLNFGYPASSAQAILDGRERNLSQQMLNGLDIDLQKRIQTTIGDFSLDINGEYIAHDSEKIVPGTPEIVLVNTIYNPPSQKWRATAAWSLGPWVANAAVNYTGGYTDNRTTQNIPVSSWTTFDVTMRYAVSAQGPNFLRGTTVTLSAINLFDKDPPYVASPYSNIFFDGANANALGRLISIEVTKRW